MVIPGVSVNQVNLTTWDLTNLKEGNYRGVLRSSNSNSTNDYYFTFIVRSTIGLEENVRNKSYQVWDWYGNYIGKDINFTEIHGFFILLYEDGTTEKVFLK
jgi:hypothetical protein